jgi:hypothetical protein
MLSQGTSKEAIMLMGDSSSAMFVREIAMTMSADADQPVFRNVWLGIPANPGQIPARGLGLDANDSQPDYLRRPGRHACELQQKKDARLKAKSTKVQAA